MIEVRSSTGEAARTNSGAATVPETVSSSRAIAVENLVKVYPGAVRALDGLSFAVDAGTIFALLGPNGAGKSTAVKILTTLSRPDSGSVSVAGLDVLKAPDSVRRAIGCVAQKSGVDQESTGRENLTLQGQLHGLGGRELKSRTGELLEQFGLSDAADRVARTYSGGMQRKLDLAMGLVHRPKVLFLDEPTTGLDPEARSDAWERISALANNQGLTILLTTHYLEEADRLARRVGIVDSGRLVVEGHPEKLKGELSGDAIDIETAEDGSPVEALEALAPSALARVERIREVTVAGRSIYARADHGATAVPSMLAALEAEGIRVASVKVARPSLDDVYLRYTGRRFSEADQAVKTVQGGAK